MIGQPIVLGLLQPVHLLASFHITGVFFQCLRKYYDTKEIHPHIVNAGKYMSKIIVAIVSIIQVFSNQSYPTLNLILTLIATLYCLIWDMTMDWGLLRESPVYPMLRAKLLFPASYYYFALTTNLILRFAWVITLFKSTIFYTSALGNQSLLFILGIAELYRRIQWSLFRVENENVNNFENYRTVLEIPELPEEEQAYQSQDRNSKTFTFHIHFYICLLYTSPSPRDLSTSRMPSSA
eukprot:TRINITY_DN3117_c0_g1_i2.p2 TRINITY_DN3117_c0_g1~~TRINITY_DN3117_c0_g1_i2.p2  ORF type:complete len:237 (+),score=13.24 TRINITY_DN3117_c0_g1_i2:827-1537(+)